MEKGYKYSFSSYTQKQNFIHLTKSFCYMFTKYLIRVTKRLLIKEFCWVNEKFGYLYKNQTLGLSQQNLFLCLCISYYS